MWDYSGFYCGNNRSSFISIYGVGVVLRILIIRIASFLNA